MHGSFVAFDREKPPTGTLDLALKLAGTLAGAMLLQAGAGLMAPGHYRDTGYVAETWLGNDLVTLLLAIPTVLTGIGLERVGSVRGRLLWLGGLGYGLYNYAFYLLGAALNALFPLYVAAVVIAGVGLILGLVATDARTVAASFRSDAPTRWVGGYLMFVALGLTAVWMVMWAAHLFFGASAPADDPAAFRLVAGLDLTLMVPALLCGGYLLWRARPWGAVIASVAAVQATLYLTVLTLNAGLFLRRGLAEPPGELPVWGTLAVFTGAATIWLLRAASSDGRHP